MIHKLNRTFICVLRKENMFEKGYFKLLFKNKEFTYIYNRVPQNTFNGCNYI